MHRLAKSIVTNLLIQLRTSAPQLSGGSASPKTVSVDLPKAQISATESHVLVNALRQRVRPSKRSAIRVIRAIRGSVPEIVKIFLEPRRSDQVKATSMCDVRAPNKQRIISGNSQKSRGHHNEKTN